MNSGPRHGLVVDPQHDDGADHRHDDAPDVDAGYAAHSEDAGEDKAPDNRPDYAERDVHDHARARLIDDLARDEPGDQPQNDPAEYTHIQASFRGLPPSMGPRPRRSVRVEAGPRRLLRDGRGKRKQVICGVLISSD